MNTAPESLALAHARDLCLGHAEALREATARPHALRHPQWPVIPDSLVSLGAAKDLALRRTATPGSFGLRPWGDSKGTAHPHAPYHPQRPVILEPLVP